MGKVRMKARVRMVAIFQILRPALFSADNQSQAYGGRAHPHSIFRKEIAFRIEEPNFGID
jgi:hypothetical protein